VRAGDGAGRRVRVFGEGSLHGYKDRQGVDRWTIKCTVNEFRFDEQPERIL
jgi:hypothetical protein